MRSENAIMPSRREFLSDALGIGLVAASTWSIRVAKPVRMYGQSDRNAANSGRATKEYIPDVGGVPGAEHTRYRAGRCLQAKQRPVATDFVNVISGSATPSWSTLLLRSSSRAPLVNRVVARGKNLTTIYATHGHGDHFFGTSTVLERFPGARFVARPDSH